MTDETQQSPAETVSHEPMLEHATACPVCDETLFGDETCESVRCAFQKRQASSELQEVLRQALAEQLTKSQRPEDK